MTDLVELHVVVKKKSFSDLLKLIKQPKSNPHTEFQCSGWIPHTIGASEFDDTLYANMFQNSELIPIV